MIVGFEAAATAQVRYFSVALPEGNYRVSIRFGDAARASDNTVRSELRRLESEPRLARALDIAGSAP